MATSFGFSPTPDQGDDKFDFLKIIRRKQLQNMLLDNPPLPSPSTQKQFPSPPEMMTAAKQKQAVDAAELKKAGLEGESDRSAAPKTLPTGNEIQAANPPPVAQQTPAQQTPPAIKALEERATALEGAPSGHQPNLKTQMLEIKADELGRSGFPAEVQPYKAPLPTSLDLKAPPEITQPTQPAQTLQETPTQPIVRPFSPKEETYARPPEVPLEATQTPSEAPQAPTVAPIQTAAQRYPTPEAVEREKAWMESRGYRYDPYTGHDLYPTSRWKHFGDIMAGIGTGIAAKDPWAGMKMYHHLEEGPFRTAQRGIEEQIGRVAPIAQLEEEQRKAQMEGDKAVMEQREKEAQARSAQATADLRKKQAENVLTYEQRLKIAQAQHRARMKGPMPVWIRDANGKISKVAANWDPDEGEFWYRDPTKDETRGEDPYVKVDPNSIVGWLDRSGALPSNPNAAKIRAWYDAHPGQEMPDEVADKITRGTAEARETPLERVAEETGGPKTQQQLHRAQQASELARKIRDRPKNVLSMVRNGLRDPALLGDEQIPSDFKGDVQRTWEDVTNGYPYPKKLDQKMMDRLHAANLSYDHIDQIQAMLKTKIGQEFMKDWLGPFLGRYVKAGENIGKIPGMDPKMQRFAGNLAFRLSVLTNQETLASSGSRFSYHIADIMRRVTPHESDNPALFLGKLEGSREVSRIIQMEASEDRFGSMGSIQFPGQPYKTATYQVIDGKVHLWDWNADPPGWVTINPNDVK